MRESLGSGLLASLVLTSYLVLVASPAAGFGTIDGGGQHREHERITRAAMACPGDGDCFQPRSLDQLAGHGKGFGAVGSPDLTEVSNPAAHCDDADFLEVQTLFAPNVVVGFGRIDGHSVGVVANHAALGFYELARRREAGIESGWPHFLDVPKRPPTA